MGHRGVPWPRRAQELIELVSIAVAGFRERASSLVRWGFQLVGCSLG